MSASRLLKVDVSNMSYPVCCSSESNTLCSILKREDFRNVNPSHRSLKVWLKRCTTYYNGRLMTYPGQSIKCNENITASNDPGCITTLDLPSNILIATNIWNCSPFGRHQSGNAKVQCTHSNTAINEERSAPPFVNKNKCDCSSDQENHILNGGGNQIDIPTVDDISVCACGLGRNKHTSNPPSETHRQCSTSSRFHQVTVATIAQKHLP